MNNQLKEKNDKTKLALKKANNFISYRPRSTTEVENKLALMFDEDIVENVVNNLKKEKLLDDLKFAKLWVTSRTLSNQKSENYIRYELEQKGISSSNINIALSEIDNDENAYNAGFKKIRSLSNLPKKLMEKKLESFLRRKGFNISTTRLAIKKLTEKNI
ncbi:MAG: recombination regulator RecX [SAR202 cluster bacterium]|nr:recombination regulator RecX [SAR202 cluster bacterium]|tara:strand:- start:1740 stop:2219 length:480 start_codon:yes stop_codon:yes gene_type:complete